MEVRKLSFEGAERSPISSTPIVRNKNRKNFWEISCYNLDMVEEEMKLLENKRAKQYKFTVMLIHIILGLVAFKLDSNEFRDSNISRGNEKSSSCFSPSTTEIEEEKSKNFICVRNPLDIPLKKLNSMKVFLSDLIYPMLPFFFILYISIKFVAMAFFQAEYNFAESKIIPKFREGAIRTKMCFFENDRYKTDLDDEQMLARVGYARAWLEAFNNPILAIGGPATALVGIIGTLPFMIYFTSVTSLLIRRRRVDVINFYLNPSCEISRVKRELNDIILKASKSLENYRSKISFEIGSSSCILSSKLNYDKRTNLELIHNSNNWNFPKIFLNHLNMFESSPSSDKLEKIISHKSNLSSHNPILLSKSSKTYNQMLFNVNLVEMVRPANLTSRLHEILIKIETYSWLVVIFAGMVPIVSVVVLSAIYELYRRVEQRLNLIECQKWKQGAALIKETIKLSSLNSQEDILAYSTYDGSISKLFRLIAQVETKYYLTRGVIFSIMEMSVSLILFVFVSSFFYYLNLRAFLTRIIWLNQIEEQIKWCTINLDQIETEPQFDDEKEIKTNQMFIYNDEDVDDGEPSFQTNSDKLIMKSTSKTTTTTKHCLLIYQKDEVRDIAAIMRAILVSYLNYELYRKQQAEYLKLATFLLVYILSMLSIIFLFSYFVGIQSSNNISKIFLLLLPTYLMMFANVHFLAGAILTSKNSSLTKRILNLLATGTRKKLQLLDIIDLWRRQLLDDDGTKKTYAVNLFGIYFAYESIITLDGYLVLLWFILLSGQKFL